METTEVSFTAKDVMTLRQKTGLGMMDCKKALTQNGGDLAVAEQWLREKLKGKMDTRTERATGEGRVGIAIDGNKAVIVEVQTETDFTARNEAFVNMVEAVTQSALGLPIGEMTEPTDEITKLVDDVRITTGENANFSRATRVDGEHFGSYVHHDGKRAALIAVDGAVDADVLKGICQHIVFHDPHGIGADDVPADKIESIRASAIAEAKDAGKNDEIATKIAEGKVRKFLQEETLVNQKYVLDESKTVQEVLPPGVTVKSFVRYTLGG